jgi:hypothetical protein
MRLTLTLSLLCCVLPTAVLAQPAGVPEPTQLELWLTHPGTRITSSEEVGRIQSTDARAVITALVIENAQIETNQLRGIRIDLSDGLSSDRVFVDEGDLVQLRNELGPISCGVTRMRNEQGVPHRVHGTGRCRPSQTIPQAYCPGYYIGPETEGLRLSTFSGHTFSFPSQLPSALADAFGRAMDEFGLDDTISPRPLIDLPAADIEQIVASAVHHYPELASSPGVKASYASDNRDAADVIFWPHERVGDFSRALTVYCKAMGNGGDGWNCDSSEPRGYLGIAGQEREVVIVGAMDRNKAVALIDYAKLKLEDEPLYSKADDGRFSQIHTPSYRGRDTYWISWRTGAAMGITLEIADAPEDAGDRFVLAKISRSDGSRCAY